MSSTFKWTAGIIIFLTFASWLVLGGIWRYSRPGRIAAGDFMKNKYKQDDAKIKASQLTYGYQMQIGGFMDDLYQDYLPAFIGVVFACCLFLCIAADSSSEDGVQDSDEENRLKTYQPKLELEGPYFKGMLAISK